MTSKQLRMLILILVLLAIAIWVDLPNNPGIHFAGIERDIKTKLGLDLVGGVQALLEADLPADAAIDAEAMNTAVRIVENRVNGLGVAEAVVQKAGERRIVVELPGETDPEQALSALKQTGLLEFVDMSSLTPQQALALEGSTIRTDFGIDNTLANTQTLTSTETLPVFHTVMTGAALKEVFGGSQRVKETLKKAERFVRENSSSVIASRFIRLFESLMEKNIFSIHKEKKELEADLSYA